MPLNAFSSQLTETAPMITRPADITAMARRDPGKALAAAMAMLHVILFAAFLLSALGATRALSAEGAACTGTDLVRKLEAEAPEKLAVARAEAAAIPNSTSIFWKITRPGIEPSWLFGTMHSPDARVARLEGPVRAAFDASGTVLVESTDALDPVKMRAAMLELKDLAFLPAGSTLETLLPQAALAPLQREAEAHGIPWAAARQMQPWMVAAAIARPVCELMAASSGKPVLDQMIALEAQKAGKAIEGLETVAEQFKAVASIPADFHVNALADLVELGAMSDDVMETTKLLYLQGNTGLIVPLVRIYSPKAYAGKGHEEFQELLVGKRNLVMAKRAGQWLDQGGVFMAVGALHLPGENGLVALLRNAGYTVEPAIP
jgi:uncharacterized protein YbaP (TraB family)